MVQIVVLSLSKWVRINGIFKNIFEILKKKIEKIGLKCSIHDENKQKYNVDEIK